MKHEHIALPQSEETRTVRTKWPLRAPGQWGNEAFYVVSGLLAVYRPLVSEGRRIVALYFPGEWVRPRAATYGIEALVPSEVNIFRDLPFDRYTVANRDATIAHEWLAVSSLSAIARVAHLLCELNERAGWSLLPDNEWMSLPLTQQHIAEITGQTSVNVNRVLAELERQGLIERDSRKFRFRRWEELVRLASFSAEYLAA